MPKTKPSKSGKSISPPSAVLSPGFAPSATVLLAVTGESPAVLTESVWALSRETPPVIPARVVVVTTTVGADRLNSELLAPSPQFGGRSAWEALRDAVLARHPEASRLLVLEPPRLITARDSTRGLARPLDDLRSCEDNAAAADFILDEVRRITANPDLRLVASIAGGRKTMGALLYAAVTLVGREADRLVHVLVNSPFDQRLIPPFFFPTRPPVRHRTIGKDETVHSSAHARIELADVPFVPLRNGFEELRAPVGGFAGLVARYSSQLRELAPSTIAFDDACRAIRVDGHAVPLENAAQLGILRTLFALQGELRTTPIDFESFAGIVRAAHGGAARLVAHDQKAAARLADRHARPSDPDGPPGWVDKLEGHDVTRALSILRTRVRSVCPHWKLQPRSLLLPPFRLAERE